MTAAMRILSVSMRSLWKSLGDVRRCSDELVSLPESVDSRVREDGAFSWEIDQVHAGAEESALARQDDDSDIGIVQSPRKCCEQVLGSTAIEGVRILGSIELDSADGTIDADEQIIDFRLHHEGKRAIQGT